MEILCLTGFSTLTDTWESSWVPEVLQTDEQGATSMTQEPLLNTQKNISRLADLYVFMHAFSTPPFSFLSGRVPLQYPWLWLDRGWLHSWGPEVSDAAAGALSLHRPVCHLGAPLWCRQCGEINVTVKESFILTWIKVSCGHEAPEVIFWWHDWSKGTVRHFGKCLFNN